MRTNRISVHGVDVFVVWMAALLMFGKEAQAQSHDINIRISVKLVCAPNGSPPTAHFGSPINYAGAAFWQQTIEESNQVLRAAGRGIQLHYPYEFQLVLGTPYFNLYEEDFEGFEQEVRANPVQYHWRENALNIYVVNTNGGTPSSPGCAGWASFPGELPQLPGGGHRRIVVMCVSTIAPLVHELGHHFNLPHTWVANHAPETPVDANPFQCDPAQGGECDLFSQLPCCMGQTPPPECCPRECCCSTKALLTFQQAIAQGWSGDTTNMMLKNIMSYHCGVLPDFRMSNGQWDKWCDAIRQWHSNETSGKPIFVNRAWGGSSNGYSGSPYKTVAAGVTAANAAGGDVLLIRTNVYNEPGFYDKKVTLRADRGSVVIGAASISGFDGDEEQVDDEAEFAAIALAFMEATGREESHSSGSCLCHHAPPVDPDLAPALVGDLNADGSVDGADIAELILRLGSPDTGGADLNGDGRVDDIDLQLLLAAFHRPQSGP